jgi:hypothetical protein
VGRLQIPKSLLDAVEFRGRARVHLAGDHIELWPAASSATQRGGIDRR